MRVTALTAGFLLTTAIISSLMVHPAMAREVKVTCLCDCPDDHKVKSHAQVRPVMPVPRRVVRRAVRRYAEGGYYNYGGSAPVYQRQWHGAWRVAPNDGFVPGPAAYYAPPPASYGPPPGYGPEGLQVDNRGWSGGVGNEGGGGGGGGGGDFGQVHFGNGGSVENGPTYNDYNQSFQFNPSQAGPFQNRLMGGLAPVKSK
jgi:hypothetical protein